MKHTKRSPLVMLLSASIMLASFVLTTCAVAQASEKPKTVAEESSSTNGPIFNGPLFEARSPYTNSAKMEGVSGDTDQSKAGGDSGLNLAQLSRGGLAPARGPRRGYAPDSYETHWMDRGSARHALIGGLIGFGVGAALAAKANKGPYLGTEIVLVGGVGALIGAAVGANHGGPGRFARHRRMDSPSGREGKEPDVDADSAGGRHEERTGPSTPLSSKLTLP